MTTSGDANFSLTREDIIQAAALEVGDIAIGETLRAEVYAQYALRLNNWIKALMADGARLWALKTATLFLTPGVAQYSLGPDGNHCTSDAYVQSALSDDALSGSTSIGLTAFSGMSDGDNIGILLPSGSLFWSTIVGTSLAVTTIADALPADVFAGGIIFTYTTKIGRPQRIVEDSAYWRSSSTQDTPIRIISRTDYAQLTNKITTGKIVQAYYDPQMVNGVLSVWPTPDSATNVLRFSYERELENFDTARDTPDFTAEWGEALILGLASRLARSAGLTLVERQELKMSANEALAIAEGYDRETAPVLIQPEMR